MLSRTFSLAFILIFSANAISLELDSLISKSSKLDELHTKLSSEEQRLSSVKSFKKYSDKDLFKMSSVLSRPSQERSVEAQIKIMRTISALKTEISGLEADIAAAQPELEAEIKNNNFSAEMLKLSDTADKIQVKKLISYKFLEVYTADPKDKTTGLDFLKHRAKTQDKVMTEIKDMISWLSLKKSLFKGLTAPQIDIIDSDIRELNKILDKASKSQILIENQLKVLK